MKTITENKTVRYIWKCRSKACGHVWAYDYTKSGTQGFRLFAGKRVWVSDDFTLLCCPECKRNLPKGEQVKGEYNPAKGCNAKCMSSTSGVCSCSCGGENHGCNHL